jgi:hypothetical protein
MPDEATPAPEEIQDTPDTPAASTEEKPASESPEDSPAASDGFEERYNNLRSEFDRRNQLLTAAEGNQGPEAQAQALRQLGVEVEMAEEEDNDEDDEFLSDVEKLEKRLEAQEQKFSQREEQEQEAHFQQLEESFIDSKLSEIEGAESMKLSETETRVVVNNALANRLDSGEPNLQGAFDDLKGIKSAARDEYLASKKAPVAPTGTAGEEKIDFSDPEAAKKWMVEDFRRNKAAAGEES